MNRRWKTMAALALIAGVALAVWWAASGPGGSTAEWRVATVDRGTIARTVSSSGNINPVVTVIVGSQVSGQIAELHADFNTEVKAGQMIARIDPRPFEAKVEEARADLAQAQANVAIQKATFSEYRADEAGAAAALKEADQDLARKRQLLARRVVANAAVDTAVAAQVQARANLNSVRARLAKQRGQISSAEAQVQIKQATLRQRELELDQTVIRSPVDGIVINRNVDIGQTVAASLQAPELFTIAQDLRKMQVETSVDEADIGRIRVGQPVAFTVDAFPDRTFDGTVRQIRKVPLEVSNVITYTVVVGAENAELLLLPGMTANVEVITGKREDALKIPNAALRFTPPSADSASSGGAQASSMTREERIEAARKRLEARIASLDERLSLSDAQKAGIAGIYRDSGREMWQVRQASAGNEAAARQAAMKIREAANARIKNLLEPAQRDKFEAYLAENAGDTRPGTIWVLGPDGSPRAVRILAGLSDGSSTEIRRGQVTEGDRVIVGIAVPAVR